MLINSTDHEGTKGFYPSFDDGPGKYRQHIEKERKSERVIQNILNIMHIKFRQLHIGNIPASFVYFILNTHSITDYIRLTTTRKQD